MFGLEESDVIERREYVNHVKQEIEVGRVERFMHRRLIIRRKDRLFDPNWKQELRRLDFAFSHYLHGSSEGTQPRSRPSSSIGHRETARFSPPATTPDKADEDAQSEWARAEQQVFLLRLPLRFIHANNITCR